jgi:hypothetical protein
MPFGGAVAQGVHCEAGPVDTAVGVHLALGCLVFVYSDTAFAAILSCGKGEGAAGMRSVWISFFS